ncbi:hypothetical protein ACFV4N_38645 [Actinosynnema sp. NPDC059797]
MSVGALTGICVAAFVAAAAFFYSRGRTTAASPVGRVLRWLAFAGTVGIAVAALPVALADAENAVVLAMLAAPVLLGLLVVIADAAGRAVGATTAIAAPLMLLWGVFLASFLTPFFVFPALLLGAAAITSIRPRGTRQAAGA